MLCSVRPSSRLPNYDRFALVRVPHTLLGLLGYEFVSLRLIVTYSVRFALVRVFRAMIGSFYCAFLSLRLIVAYSVRFALVHVLCSRLGSP